MRVFGSSYPAQVLFSMHYAPLATDQLQPNQDIAPELGQCGTDGLDVRQTLFSGLFITETSCLAALHSAVSSSVADFLATFIT